MGLGLLAVGYGVLFYESPIRVVSTETIDMPPSPRFAELSSKSSLTLEEFEELKMESYKYWKSLSPSNDLSFEEWQKKYTFSRKP